jgi:hypothetical protein
MLKAETPPIISSKAHEMSNWRNGEVESHIGVSHSRVMEDAVMGSASPTVERMTPADKGFIKNKPVTVYPTLLHVLSIALTNAS